MFVTIIVYIDVIFFIGSFVGSQFPIFVKLVKLFLTCNKITVTIFTHCFISKNSNITLGKGFLKIISVYIEKSVPFVGENVSLYIVKKFTTSCQVIHIMDRPSLSL